MPIFVEGSEEEIKMTTKQEFKGVAELLWKPHTTQVRVRYGETDAMGYVYYGNYALYFEVGRNETMRKLGFPYGRIEEYCITILLHITTTSWISPQECSNYMRHL